MISGRGQFLLDLCKAKHKSSLSLQAYDLRITIRDLTSLIFEDSFEDKKFLQRILTYYSLSQSEYNAAITNAASHSNWNYAPLGLSIEKLCSLNKITMSDFLEATNLPTSSLMNLLFVMKTPPPFLCSRLRDSGLNYWNIMALLNEDNPKFRTEIRGLPPMHRALVWTFGAYLQSITPDIADDLTRCIESSENVPVPASPPPLQLFIKNKWGDLSEDSPLYKEFESIALGKKTQLQQNALEGLCSELKLHEHQKALEITNFLSADIIKMDFSSPVIWRYQQDLLKLVSERIYNLDSLTIHKCLKILWESYSPTESAWKSATVDLSDDVPALTDKLCPTGRYLNDLSITHNGRYMTSDGGLPFFGYRLPIIKYGYGSIHYNEYRKISSKFCKTDIESLFLYLVCCTGQNILKLTVTAESAAKRLLAWDFTEAIKNMSDDDAAAVRAILSPYLKHSCGSN